MKKTPKILTLTLILTLIISNSMFVYGSDDKVDETIIEKSVTIDLEKSTTVTGSAVEIEIDSGESSETEIIPDVSGDTIYVPTMPDMTTDMPAREIVTGPAVNITFVKTEITDFLEKVDLSMSYEFIDENRIIIKANYVYKTDILLDKIMLEDSVFGNFDLILHDDLYIGERSKEILIDDMFQNIFIKAFYNAEVTELP